MPYGPTATASTVANAKKQILFGDGRDGSFIYSIANTRWEDAAGNALVTSAGNWTVAGAVLTFLRTIRAVNVTVAVGATLQIGADNGHGGCELYCSGIFTVNGTFRPGFASMLLAGDINVAGVAPTGGLAKTVAGAGNSSGGRIPGMTFGIAGSAGAGGGDGTNIGGNGSCYLSTARHVLAVDILVGMAGGTSAIPGLVNAGTAGPAASTLQTIDSNYDSPWMKIPGTCGLGAGSGAMKQAGGTNVGGAGGVGGRGRFALRASVHALVLAATGLVHCDGEAGTAGSNGIATNAAGDISGGGGGGGGGAGGPIAIRYGSIVDAGATWRSNGGVGGAGGLGFAFNATLRPTSDGGAGGAGTTGTIVKELAS